MITKIKRALLIFYLLFTLFFQKKKLNEDRVQSSLYRAFCLASMDSNVRHDWWRRPRWLGRRRQLCCLLLWEFSVPVIPINEFLKACSIMQLSYALPGLKTLHLPRQRTYYSSAPPQYYASCGQKYTVLCPLFLLFHLYQKEYKPRPVDRNTLLFPSLTSDCFTCIKKNTSLVLSGHLAPLRPRFGCGIWLRCVL